MKALFFLLMSIASLSCYPHEKLALYDLTLDSRQNPIGIDNPAPRFSWKIKSSLRNVQQKGYEVRVATSENDLGEGKNLAWNSGVIPTDQSLYILYGGSELRSRQRYYWQVRVTDNYNNTSDWSEVQYWEMGFLDTSEWSAKWIEAAEITDGKAGAPPVFYKDFDLSTDIKSARLYITSHGIYDVTLNGNRINEDLFTPGWTAYQKRLQYQVYDVTSLLEKGKNSTLVTVGDGWYRGYLEWKRERNFYGKEVALLYQLEIQLTNGEKIVVQSDSTWKSSFDGPIRYSDIYMGEMLDTRIDESDIRFVDTVRVKDFSLLNLIAQQGPVVRRQEVIQPIDTSRSPKGELIVDFGQNLVGWVRVNIKGNAGDTLALHHAEVLDQNGDLYTQSLRTAKQENKFVLNGQQQVIEPHFTFQGFRYLRLSGAAVSGLDVKNLTAVAIYSDMELTGLFASSNTEINQLQHNIQWGQKGNFLDIPTDCPQRDERLGWTGDAQVFFNTAAYNMNVNLFFKKWLGDIKAEQYDNGNVPVVIPKTVKRGTDGSAGWSDVATIIPWRHFVVYGDTSILADQYFSMKKWVDFITSESEQDLWKRTSHYGDWLFYTMADDRDGKAAITDKSLIAQAFYAASTQNLIHAARVLGKDADVAKYTALLGRVKEAFNHEFVTPSGKLVSNSQTAYVLALNFDLLPEEMRAQAAKRLADNIKAYGYHITTGFLGTPYINHVLTRFNYNDVAFKLLLQDTYPSWLYPIKKGATTIWERWDGIKPNGDFQNHNMNSFNHYAYGAIGDWMYKVITGIDVDSSAVAYKRIVIAPHVDGGLTHANGSLETLYGTVRSSWKFEGRNMHLHVSIPANTSAKIVLPHSKGTSILEKGKNLASVEEIKRYMSVGNSTVCELGSGEYEFQYVLVDTLSN